MSASNDGSGGEFTDDPDALRHRKSIEPDAFKSLISGQINPRIETEFNAYLRGLGARGATNAVTRMGEYLSLLYFLDSPVISLGEPEIVEYEGKEEKEYRIQLNVECAPRPEIANDNWLNDISVNFKSFVQSIVAGPSKTDCVNFSPPTPAAPTTGQLIIYPNFSDDNRIQQALSASSEFRQATDEAAKQPIRQKIARSVIETSELYQEVVKAVNILKVRMAEDKAAGTSPYSK
jgi:hypothetical protein